MIRLKKSSSFLLLSLASAGAGAGDLHIQAMSGNNNDLEIPAGIPILSTNQLENITRYDTNGNINNYYWVNGFDEMVTKGVTYIPSLNDVGNSIRLCQSTRMNGTGGEVETNVTCSNTLNIIEQQTVPVARTVQRASTNVLDFWDINPRVGGDDIIYSDTATTNLSITYDINYKDSSISTFDEIPQGTPFVSDLYYTVKDQDGQDLVGFTAISKTSDNIHNGNLERAINNTTSLSLGDTEVVSLCTFGLATVGTPYFSTQCSSRIVENNASVIQWSKPPTAIQYAFFNPGKSFVQSGDYVASPYYSSDDTNLFAEFCEKVGTYITPTINQLLDHNTALGGFDSQNWPSFSNYWTNEVTTGPIPLPGVIWNMTVNLENNAQEAAPNKSYSGLFSCLKNF